MAHELTRSVTGNYEMAFVGDTPWHGLGQSVTKGASIEVWKKQAGMNWSALQSTPAITTPGGDILEFSGHKALYRSDTFAPLAIVGSDYQVVQPADVLEFFRDITENGGWHIHTAGTMRGGRRLWAMATTEDAQKLVKLTGRKSAPKFADAMQMNLLLATSLDGSMKTTAMLTSVRVVCANTLRIALNGMSDPMVRVSHRTVFDPQMIKRALGVARESFDIFMDQARRLAETPADLGEARDVLNKIFRSTAQPKPNLTWLSDNLAEVEAAPEQDDSRATGRVLELFAGAGMGADLPTAKGTRWGLLNAVTQYVDHEMGRTRDTGLDAAWFGRGKDFKQQAFDLLTEEA